MQYPDIDWILVAYAIGCPPAVVIFLRHLQQPQKVGFVRRAARVFTIVGIAMSLIVLGGMAWLVGEYRFYEDPLFYHLPLALSPLLLGALLATSEGRRCLFGDQWSPVFICWGIILLVSVGSVLKFAAAPSPWFEIWGMSATIIATLLVVVGICVGLAWAAWRYGIRAGVTAMRVAAGGIRRLM